jgi:hypothetical protein
MAKFVAAAVFFLIEPLKLHLNVQMSLAILVAASIHAVGRL